MFTISLINFYMTVIFGDAFLVQCSSPERLKRRIFAFKLTTIIHLFFSFYTSSFCPVHLFNLMLLAYETVLWVNVLVRTVRVTLALITALSC